jgi:CHAT domain-containing protein
MLGRCLAMLGAAMLVSCTPGDRSAADGVVIFDAVVVLERGERIDSAHRDFPVDGASTFVAMVDENDSDVKVLLSHSGAPGVAPATIEIDSNLDGEGIEIAALDAPAGSRFTVSLESAQNFNRAGNARLRLMRYDTKMAADSSVAARLAAFHAWSASTSTRLTGEEIRTTALPDIDRALAHLESAEGNPALASWGRMVRAKLNYRQSINLKVALEDARSAERGFAAVGAARNAARARLMQAMILAEIVYDKNAKDPSAEEAAQRAKQMLNALSTERSLNDLERARAVNFLGVLAYNVYDAPEARARFLQAMQAFEAIGNMQGRLMVLGNLGAMAVEAGDYDLATRYSDQVLAELHRFGSVSVRTQLLYNAARTDITTGNVDRAIERLLHALELTRENNLRPNEARSLYGLGMAYWTRGDTAQASSLLDEALKLRRTLDDPVGLVTSLGASGTLAREAGDLQKALAMHREAVSRAPSPDLRVITLRDLALDYQAALDYPLAIATAREALSVQVGVPNFYKRRGVQLALADMLLAQPHRTSQAMREATMLTQDVLKTATLGADIHHEIAARRLLAKSHAARGAFGEARDEYEKAIALIFKYRSTINNPELRAATLAYEQKTFRDYVDLLMRDVVQRGPGKLLPVSRKEEDALRTLEWARAINFDSRRVAQLDAVTQSRLDELLAQMAGKRVRIASLGDRTDDASRELEVLQLEIARLRAEVDRLRAAAASRESKEARNSSVVDVPWSVTSPGATQLSYALETEHAYLWVRDVTGIRVTVLAANSATIAREVAALAAATREQRPRQLDAILGRLSTILIPVDAIRKDASKLEIVAEGQVAMIPFAGLSSPQETPRRLSEIRSIVMIGSLFQSRERSRPTQPRPWGFVALANDTSAKGDSSAAKLFPALRHSGAEARAIATQFQRREPPVNVRLLLGAQGSADTLEKTWRDGVDVFHIATHGLADMRQPLASMLLLPALDPAGKPTYLTAGQVQEWRGDADLVYLSACETAVGPARFADGLPGLQRAFLRAGARGVIATLWPVEDVYASQFASDFYRRYTAGVPAPQALSETQRAWMQPAPDTRDTEQIHRRITAWAHVFYAQ